MLLTISCPKNYCHHSTLSLIFNAYKTLWIFHDCILRLHQLWSLVFVLHHLRQFLTSFPTEMTKNKYGIHFFLTRRRWYHRIELFTFRFFSYPATFSNIFFNSRWYDSISIFLLRHDDFFISLLQPQKRVDSKFNFFFRPSNW